MAAAAYPTRIGPGSCLRDGDDDDLGQPPLRIGEKVFWLGEEQPEPGVVKWIGLLPDVCSEWTAGVALENEVGSMNGTWAGRVLFSCKQNHGIVISVNGLIKADDFLGNAAVEDGKTTDRPFPLAEQNGHRGDPDGAQQPPSCSVDSRAEVSATIEAAEVNRGDLEIGRFLSTRNAGRSSSFDRRVYARMFAECEVEKWYEALDFSSPDVTGSFPELSDVGDPFPTGRHARTSATLTTMSGSRTADTLTGSNSKRPPKKKERGGIFRFFRWLRRSRSSSKVSTVSPPTQASTCPQKRRTLPHVGIASVDANSASKRARSLESVTSISDSFHYIPVSELRAREQEDEKLGGGTLESTTTFDPTDQFYEDLDADGNVLTAVGASRASPPKVKSNSLSRTMADEREKRRREILGDSNRSERSVKSVCAGSMASGSSRKKRRAPLPPPANLPGIRDHWVKVLPSRQSSVQSERAAEPTSGLGRASAGSTGALYGNLRRPGGGDDPTAASTPRMKRASSLTSAEVEVRPTSAKPVRAASYARNKKRAPLPPIQQQQRPNTEEATTGKSSGGQERAILNGAKKKDEEREEEVEEHPAKSGSSRPVSIFRCHLEGVGLVDDSRVLLRSRSDKDDAPNRQSDQVTVAGCTSEAGHKCSPEMVKGFKTVGVDTGVSSGNATTIFQDKKIEIDAVATAPVGSTAEIKKKESEIGESDGRKRNSNNVEKKLRVVKSANVSPVSQRVDTSSSLRKQSSSSFAGFAVGGTAQIEVTSTDVAKRNSRDNGQDSNEERGNVARRISNASLGGDLSQDLRKDSMIKPIEQPPVPGDEISSERRNSKATALDGRKSLERSDKIQLDAVRPNEDIKTPPTYTARRLSGQSDASRLDKEINTEREKMPVNDGTAGKNGSSPAPPTDVGRSRPMEWRRNSRTSSSDGSENQSPRLRRKLEIEEEEEEGYEDERRAAVAAAELVRAENKVNLQALQDLVESLVLQYCETAKVEDKVRKRDEGGGCCAPPDLVPITVTARTAPVSAVPKTAPVSRESMLEARLRKLSEKKMNAEAASSPAEAVKTGNGDSKIYDDSKIYEDDDDNLANELLERWQMRMRNHFVNFDLGVGGKNAGVFEKASGNGNANECGRPGDSVYEPIEQFLRSSRRPNTNGRQSPSTRTPDARTNGSDSVESPMAVDEDGIPADPFLFWRDLCQKGNVKGGDVIPRVTSGGESVGRRRSSAGRERRSFVEREEEEEDDRSDSSDPASASEKGMMHPACRMQPAAPVYRMYENVSMNHGGGPFVPVSHLPQAPWPSPRFVPANAYVMSAAIPDPRLCRPPFDPITGFPLIQRAPGTTVFPHYPSYVGAYPTAARLPYAAGYFYPAPPSTLLTSTSNPLYQAGAVERHNAKVRLANSSTNGTRERQNAKNGRMAFQQSRQPPNGAGSSSSGRYNRLERRSSSEDSWGDALDGSPTSDSPGKKVYVSANDVSAPPPTAAVRRKRDSCSDLPPVPPPRASTCAAPAGASRLAAGCSWLKESSKSVEAKIEAARQSDDPLKVVSLKRTASLDGPKTTASNSARSVVSGGGGSSLPRDFRSQRAAMDSFVVIGGVRVATPLKLWPLEYELIAPELRIVQARLAGRPLPEDASLLECEVGGSDVNGLAVKRLLKLLEISIGEGRLEEAATFARDLAQLKIQCCVTLNRRPANSDEASPIILNMFVEDKVSHHGPIPIRVSPSINVGELKNKIFHEFEFPVQIQRWILGKKLAMDDSASLSHFGITNDGCPVFLYLISPEDVSLKSSDLVWDNDRPKSSNRSRRSKIKKEIETSTSRPTSRVGNHGWTCTRCTMANAPSRPACSACKCEKPADYRLTVKCEEQTDEDSDARRKQREEEEKANAEAKELARLRNWQQYLRLDDQDLIFNQTAFECSVCFCETPPGEGVQLRDCLHLFCCDCLRNAVFHSDAASVGCPFRDDHYSCDSTLQEREIRALVPPDVFERHLQRSVVTAESQAANSFHCKTPDCQGWCLIEEKVNQFLCPACQHVSCITCRVNHEKMNCRQYQDQLDVLARTDDEARKTKEAVEMMLARGEAMNCPSCAVVIMKKWGCDWLACSICKSEICWVTKGPRWGPKGRGDTTAGCRCGINGIKCHQQCNYCH